MSSSIPSRALRTEPVEDTFQEVCLRVAGELEALRLRSMRLEQSLCNGTDWVLDAGGVREFQELDYLLQHLAALRDFMTALGRTSDAAPGRLEIAPALNRIRLAGLKLRLAGGEQAALRQDDIEFF